MAEAARAAETATVPAPSRGRVGRQVRVPKTAELVAAHLRRQIVRGELKPGDALPPESGLMEQFGISRPTLREAFRVLESESLITVRRGAHGGARVSAPGADVAARFAGLILEYRGTTLGDLHRAAALIEPPCARTLATKHTAGDIKRLRDAVAAEKAVLDDPLALVEAQDTFHALLVELTGNQTLALLCGMVRNIIDRANASYTAAATDSGTRKAQALKGHRAHVRLVGLIESGKADEAEKLWQRHLTAADDVVNAAGPKTVLELLD
ncbi:FadR/GntR family transcriptional regulator [Streptomyces sp. NL15-2K]|uniref:FadR/GntR family transcriptional regulator n=1 Tax=Streptomyces sp. NL15-2K TaxID=376149 RepID=UPI000F560F78|nr:MULTISPECIES: GntR family transcriptional regulator [Actinomycetes]WKX14730.1 GntR family transcriptional regulator [Kutzneria buriramensis]GCB44120.1 gntR family transcriptional regulator [Streptomyces sp. NL15-2K]